MPAETKTKKAGAKGQETSCLFSPAYAATDPPDIAVGLPLVSSSVVFVCGLCRVSGLNGASLPKAALMNRKQSLTNRWKYIAQPGVRKEDELHGLSLRLRRRVLLKAARSETVGYNQLFQD